MWFGFHWNFFMIIKHKLANRQTPLGSFVSIWIQQDKSCYGGPHADHNKNFLLVCIHSPLHLGVGNDIHIQLNKKLYDLLYDIDLVYSCIDTQWHRWFSHVVRMEEMFQQSEFLNERELLNVGEEDEPVCVEITNKCK